MKSKKAFTLIELLVVIAIIGILATISVLALSNARAKSRDAKRAGDMKQVQTALELFFNDKNRYPTAEEWATGQIYSTTTDSISTYMQIIPAAVAPADGTCTSNQNTISYTPTEAGASYAISFCLGGNTGTLNPGPKCLTPGGIIDTNCFVCGSSVLSYNNYNYLTVQIGDQCWLKENLRTINYNDGSSIANLTNDAAWGADTSGAYAWYNNSYETYGSVYGALYNFYAINPASNGGKNICPIGWHVPTDADFKILVEGQATPNCESVGIWGCSPAGSHLSDYTLDHDNSSGFSALIGGLRYRNGSFNSQGVYAYFFSSSFNNPDAWYRHLWPNSSGVDREDDGWGHPAVGMSVRCLKD